MARELRLRVLEDEKAFLWVGQNRYPIPDKLTISMMARFMRIQKQVQRAGEGGDEVQIIEAMNETHDAVVDYLRLETPDVHVQLSPDELGEAVNFILGNDKGAEAEAVDALAGDTDPDDPGDDDGGDGNVTPLASTRPSSKRSSGSATSKGGSRGTGTPSSGVTSGSTSKSTATV